jgi:predicted O-linked N-acetylglucosamine transferase (SPINDLY family)
MSNKSITNYQGWLDLASQQFDLGKYHEAISSAAKAHELNTRQIDPLLYMANAYLKLRDFDKAIIKLNTAHRIEPRDDLILWLLAFAYFQNNQLEKSADHSLKALKINPNLQYLRLYISQYLSETQSQYTKAIQLVTEEIQLHPKSDRAYRILGALYASIGEIKTAIELTQKQISINTAPNKEAYDNLITYLHYCPRLSPDEILQAANQYYQAMFPGINQEYDFKHLDLNPHKQVLRLGFISGDLRHHAVSYYIKDLFSRLVCKGFEIYCYCNNPADAVTEELKAQVQGWHQINQKSTEEVIKLIKSDRIDILVDLAGHTGLNRLEIFAYRPSPLQVTWLGQSGPLGLPQIDYMLTHGYFILNGEESHYTEKLYLMPNTYSPFYPPDIDIEVKAAPCLEKGFVTFGSFNNFLKVNSDVLNLWAKILKAVPNAKLLIKAKVLADEPLQVRLRQFFNDQGISAERLILEVADSRNNYLQAYNNIDIALDPFPLTGGTTSHDALWMSVPIITLYGQRMSHRISAGLLNLIGCDELVAKSEDEYLNKAVALAGDLPRIEEYKKTIRPKYLASPVCDPEGFAEDFAEACRIIWQKQSLNF